MDALHSTASRLPPTDRASDPHSQTRVNSRIADLHAVPPPYGLHGAVSRASSVLPPNPAMPPANVHVLTPLPPAARAGGQRALPKAFSAIAEKTRDVFIALRKAQAAMSHGISQRNKQEKMANTLGEALNAHKTWRDADPRQENFMELVGPGLEAYDKLKGTREETALEKLLPGAKRKLFPQTGQFRDPKTGLMADLTELKGADGKPVLRDGRPVYVLSFMGTGRGAASRAQWLTNVRQFLGMGGVPHAHQQAADLAGRLLKVFNTMNPKPLLTLSGHSLGGGIANYVGLKLDLEATCYNPAALGAATQRDILAHIQALKRQHPETKLGDRVAKQTLIRTESDPISHPKTQVMLALASGLLMYDKLAVPHSYGTWYQLDNAEVGGSPRTLVGYHKLGAFDSGYQFKLV